MLLPDYSTSQILVVGDLMLDRYWHGATSRISPEAPVPVVHVRNNEQRVGGAGNVALNIAALGAKASLFGFTGDDEAADELTKILDSAQVKCFFERLERYPTITKLRVMSRHQQLIRLDFEDGFFHVKPDFLLSKYQNELDQADVIILSDYGKGTLSAVNQFIQLARSKSKKVLVDPKGADFSIYRDATVITPNLNEFETIVGRCTDDAHMVEKGINLIQELSIEALLITRGEHGMTLINRSSEPLHLPTHAREVYDVTGAGDTVISVLAASIAANKSLSEATKLANIGAGIVVGKMGTATISIPEFNRGLENTKAHHRGVVEEETLISVLKTSQLQGEKVVATNGCFDILHPGHVNYLKQARELGDRLIVLVNSDASVKRLKGSDRPINDLTHRMQMLAALECVDWVVSFNEDTPEALISRLSPDILVKGGDYQDISQIAGSKDVLAKGGEVKILPFVDGHSTSKIIDSIKKQVTLGYEEMN